MVAFAEIVIEERINLMKQFFGLIGKRFRDLIVKMISMKFLFAVGATVLKFCDRLDDWVWFMVVLAVISVRAFEKKVDKIQIGRGYYPPGE